MQGNMTGKVFELVAGIFSVGFTAGIFIYMKQGDYAVYFERSGVTTTVLFSSLALMFIYGLYLLRSSASYFIKRKMGEEV